MVKLSPTAKKKLISETAVAVAQTKTLQDAAELLGISEYTIHKRLKSNPEIREAIEKIPELARLRLQQAALEAAEVKVSGLQSHREDVRQETSSEILDRVGLGAPRGESSVNVNVITAIQAQKDKYGI